MVIWSWVGAIVGLACVVAAIFWIVWAARGNAYDEGSKIWHILGGVLLAIVGIALAVWCMFWLYGTESGQRALETFGSETQGGITRSVRVYDLNGKLIESYEGRFDIEYDEERIMFDILQDDGTYQRHQIFNTTGTVLIDEK